jgi:hypothetical protein
MTDYAQIQAKSEELADLIISIPADENLKISNELELQTGMRLEDLHLLLSRLSQLEIKSIN